MIHIVSVIETAMIWDVKSLSSDEIEVTLLLTWLPIAFDNYSIVLNVERQMLVSVASIVSNAFSRICPSNMPRIIHVRLDTAGSRITFLLGGHFRLESMTPDHDGHLR